MDSFGRIAIFSDVHGNLEALQTVQKKIAEANVDRMICLGDTVGYGADPNTCLEGVRAASDFVLAGNHDWAVVGLEDLAYFNPIAREAVEWTARVISEENAALLRAYKPTREEGGCCYAHATPLNPAEWGYLFDPDEGSYALAYTNFAMCFVGHSHRAFVCSASRKTTLLREGSVRLADDDRYLVNAWGNPAMAMRGRPLPCGTGKKGTLSCTACLTMWRRHKPKFWPRAFRPFWPSALRWGCEGVVSPPCP